jgi:hypothetical protein
MQEESSDQSNSIPRQPAISAGERPSNISRDADELTRRSSLALREQLTEKKAITHTVEHAEEDLDQNDEVQKRIPDYISLTDISVPQVPPEEPRHPMYRKTRFETGVNEFMSSASRTFNVDPERPRRVSAAPGIDAPPLNMLQRGLKPTSNGRRHRIKEQHYPPDEQHPPAPAYPSRETPSWTRPDKYTPPLNPKAELEERKECGCFGRVPRSKSVRRDLPVRWSSASIEAKKHPETDTGISNSNRFLPYETTTLRF